MRRILVSFTGAIVLLTALFSTPAGAATTAALWHMDETSGTTAIDSSGNSNNGSLTGITFTSPGFDGTGGAYSFNGTSSKVLVPDSASLNPGSADVSITVHVKFTVKPPISPASQGFSAIRFFSPVLSGGVMTSLTAEALRVNASSMKSCLSDPTSIGSGGNCCDFPNAWLI